MAMGQTLSVINAMEAEGVINRYALAGAVAALNYIDPTATEDLDILVSFAGGERTSGLIMLDPILAFLRTRGYTEFRKEGILIEGWPVQFLPVASELDAEALSRSENIELSFEDEAVETRVLRPEHLVAIALRVGRPKDLIRITQFLSQGAVDLEALCAVIERHRLTDAWLLFCAKAGLSNPCAAGNIA